MKKPISVILFFLACIASNAQETFQIVYGDTSYNEVKQVIQTSDGNYAFIGSKIVGDSMSDILLTKMDTVGNILFAVRDSTVRDFMSWNDFGFDFKQTPDNGFIICGSSFGSPLDPDLEDVVLIKTDQNGFIQWANAYSGFGTDRASGLSISYDDKYFLAGFTNSGDSGYNQGLVMKIDFSGVPVWSKVNSIFNNSHFNDGCCTTDSCFIAIGCTIDSFGSKDLFAVKYDSIGNEVWSKRFSAAGDQDGNAVVATSDGGCVVAGNNSADTSVNSMDILVVKLDTSGSVQWAKTYNHLHEDRATNIIQLSNGNYALSGFSNVTDTINPVTLADFIELDSLGDTLIIAMYGDSLANNLAYSLAALSGGGFLLGGVSYGSGKPNGIAYLIRTDSAAGTLTCQSSLSLTYSAFALSDSTGSDADSIALNYSSLILNTDLYQVPSFYTYYDYCLSLSTAEYFPASTCIVYPNPVKQTLNIDFHDSGLRFEKLIIHDVFGRTIFTKKIQAFESTMIIDSENLKPGIYQIELRGQQNSVSRKFVKLD